MSEPKDYPAGMSAERFKALTSPFELTRFGKKFPIQALYAPEALMKILKEKEAKGEVFDKPSSEYQDVIDHDGYFKLRNKALHPMQRDSTGQYRCCFCGSYKDLPNNPVASGDSGK